MKQWISLSVMTMLISLSNLAVAASEELKLWTDHAPSALAPFGGSASKLAALAGDEVVIYSHAPSANELPSDKGARRYAASQFNTAALVVPVKADKVRELLGNYESYVGLYPTLTKAKVTKREGNTSLVDYRIEIPIPVPILSVKEDVTLQHTLGANSLSTILVDSPIPYGSGTFEWFELPGGKTLVTLTQWGDLDAPRGWILRAVFKAMPEIKQSIPQSVSAFVLESLRLRLAPTSLPPATKRAQLVPTPEFSAARRGMIDQLISASGEPVIFSHAPNQLLRANAPNETLHFVTAIDHVDAQVGTVKTLLGDPTSLPSFLRQVKKVKQVPIPGRPASDNEIKVGVGLGIISIPFDFKMRYINESAGTVRYSANGGDLEFLEGRMNFEPLGSSQTRVIMTSAAKVGEDAPFLLRISRLVPYYDYLPAIGMAPLLFNRTERFLSGKKA